MEKRQIVPSFFCNQQEVIFIDFFSLFVKHEKVTVFFADRDAEADENSESASLTPRELQVYEAYFEQRKKVPEIVQETGESEQALRGVIKRIRSKARKMMEIAVFFFIATCFYFSRS